jgi:phosphoribosylanthranilate isomerase
MKLKVCGITTVDQLDALAKMKIDFAGLIFVKSSQRFALEKLSADKEAIKNCEIKKVGVFVNEEMDIVKQRIKDFGLDLVQLHGDEDPDYAGELNKSIPVIKAFRISGNENISEITEAFKNCCSYYLFDTLSLTGDYGGTGKSFNWDVLRSSSIDKPFFLSGGISAEHTDVLKTFSNPSLFAVDINSRFETEPGIKDLDLVQKFKKNLIDNL